jgi:hypothetical protein
MAVVTRPENQPMGIVALPRPRNSTIDLHHLMWPLSDMRQAGLEEFSTMQCSKARRVDSMTHSVIHQIHVGILVLSSQPILKSVGQLARQQVQRHNHRRCACYASENLRFIDAFSLVEVDPWDTKLAPCTVLAVDSSAYLIMKEFYRENSAPTELLRIEFKLRCERGECGCFRQLSGEKYYMPSVWEEYSRLSA